MMNYMRSFSRTYLLAIDFKDDYDAIFYLDK